MFTIEAPIADLSRIYAAPLRLKAQHAAIQEAMQSA